MVVFPFPQFKQYVHSLKSLPDYRSGHFQITRFPNQELYVKIFTSVAHKDCLIIGSITPPDEQLISFLFLAHTLKKELASKITVLLPYLAYARQDKIKKGESLATSTVGEIFRASHIDEVVTIDVHSQKAESLFPLPIHNLSPAKLFGKEKNKFVTNVIKKIKLKNLTFVSPDEGAVERTQKVMKELGVTADITYMKKERMATGVSSVLHGRVSQNVVIIDDILDTGGTLLACCKNLKSSGAKNIYIFVTHGLFTGNRWPRLFDLNVRKIYCTDSIPGVSDIGSKNLKILSIKPLLKSFAHQVRKIHEEAEKAMKRIEKREQDFFLGEEAG